MYSTLSAGAPASDGIWLVFAALRLLDEAVDALADAEAMARGLADDAAWRNRGRSARSMSEALANLHMSMGAHLSAVQHARAVVRGAVIV